MAREHLARIERREDVLAFVEQYHLAEHDTSIARAILALQHDNGSRLGQHLFRTVCDRCARYVTFHHQYPFITASRHVLHVGTQPILCQFADHSPISFTPGESARGLIVIGSTGSGKTVLLLRIADADLATNQEWIVDAKDDARALAVRHQHVLVFTATSPVDLLARPPYLSVNEHVALLTEGFARTMYIGQTGKAVLHEALTKLFTEFERPTLAELITTVDGLLRKGDTYDRANAIRNIALRIRRLVSKFPGFTATPSVPLHQLCEHSVLWSLTAYTDLEDLIVTLAVLNLFHHHRAHNLREHTTTIHVDEALLAFREENGRHINGNLLAELVGLTREYGIAWRLSVNTLSLVDPAVIANTFAIIALNVNSGNEAQAVARTLGLSPEQAEYHARKLTRGQALLRLGDRWRYPLLCTYEDLPFPKTVSGDAWAAATHRIQTLAAREGDNGQPTPAHAPSSSPPSRVAPVVEVPSNVRRIALNKHATALLHDVAAHPLTLSTPSYRRCNLRLSEGDRAKTLLVNIGFLESHRVRTGTGRGKTGSALRLTPAGWEWLGKKPAKGTRGGDSVQHAFTIHELHRRIRHSSVETLGADLVVSYNTTAHQQLHRALETLSDRKIRLNDGDLLALEVECSRPAVTAPRNIARNAGFAVTIIAVLGKVDELEHQIGEQDRVVILDVLRLLDALREDA